MCFEIKHDPLVPKARFFRWDFKTTDKKKKSAYRKTKETFSLLSSKNSAILIPLCQPVTLLSKGDLILFVSTPQFLYQPKRS